MDVYEKDTNIGTCIDVLELPQGELLVVKRKSLKNALIPFRKEFVENVDKDKGTIHIFKIAVGENKKSKLSMMGGISNYFGSEWSFC